MRNDVTEKGNDHRPSLTACINSWSPSLDSLFVGSRSVVNLIRGVTLSVGCLYIMGVNTVMQIDSSMPSKKYLNLLQSTPCNQSTAPIWL
jgi:hypothetical protein